MNDVILAQPNLKYQRERERERAEITYTGKVNGEDLTVKLDLLEHKKSKVDKSFKILGLIAAEESIENLDNVKNELKKIEGTKLPEELSHKKLQAKVNALYNLREAISNKPKAAVFTTDKEGSLLTSIGNVLKTLQDLIPKDGEAGLSGEQIAAYKKLKTDVEKREIELLIEQALLQDDKGKR
jgi:hypothetical protein